MTTIAAQPSTEDDGPLSPWWMRAVLVVMLLGFTGLITITLLAYRNAPPVPEQVQNAAGSTVFTGDDIRDGQTVFLKYGLMANGSIWGHGAYLGPDYSAQALHQLGEHTAQAIAQQRFGKAMLALAFCESLSCMQLSFGAVTLPKKVGGFCMHSSSQSARARMHSCSERAATSRSSEC